MSDDELERHLKKFLKWNKPGMYWHQGAPGGAPSLDRHYPFTEPEDANIVNNMRSARALKQQRRRTMQSITHLFHEFLKSRPEYHELRNIDAYLMRLQGLTCQYAVMRNGNPELCGEPLVWTRGKRPKYCDQHRKRMRSRQATLSKEKKLTREEGPKTVLGVALAEQVLDRMSYKPLVKKRKRGKEPLIA